MMKKQVSVIFAMILVQVGFSQTMLTLEEAVRQQFGKFYPEHLQELNWINSTNDYQFVKNDTLWKGNATAAELALPFISKTDLSKWSGYTLADMPHLEWTSEFEFWYEADGKYFNGNIQSKKIKQMNQAPEGAENLAYHPKNGHLAYTIGNNLFIKTNQVYAVTADPEFIVHGQSISRNEYGIEKGIFWSPDGNFVAFYTKDESQVADYPLTNYKTVPATVNNIKYPMSGGKSEIVSLNVFPIKNVGTKDPGTGYITLNITDEEGKKSDQFYITNVGWTPNSESILCAWINRKTDRLKLMHYNTKGEYIGEILQETDPRWVEPDQAPIFIPGKRDEFLWRSYRGECHEYFHYKTDGSVLGKVNGWEQEKIKGFDNSGKWMLVEGRSMDGLNTTGYLYNTQDKKTTYMNLPDGIHDLQLSADGKMVLDTYSNKKTPNKSVVLNNNGTVKKELLNAADKLKDKKIGITEVGQINGHDGTILNYRIIKPSNFDPKKKYPVLVYVYNGPHVQLINNGYLSGASLWMNYFAEKDFLVFTLDGRGSASRGKNFEQAIHRQLGTVEMEDQMAGVEWLRSQPYVDETKMAIHGWSFGGFMTTSMMLRQPGVFKCGVAGGPVLDWTLYEVMYTERYMDTPAENPEGYKNNNMSEYVKNLSGPLLMIHGTDDNVVVMQHNMRFLSTCITNLIPIDFFAYPGHEHNVRGKDRVHLMHKVLDYVEHEVHH
jgi:dipeptidyl-peptidase-4